MPSKTLRRLCRGAEDVRRGAPCGGTVGSHGWEAEPPGAGRRFGIERQTVKKTLSYSTLPGSRRTKPVRRPKLEGITSIIDVILEADREGLRRQQHTAQRIFEHRCATSPTATRISATSRSGASAPRSTAGVGDQSIRCPPRPMSPHRPTSARCSPRNMRTLTKRPLPQRSTCTISPHRNRRPTPDGYMP